MDIFETYRPLLFSIAYRMLGSAMEAEDMVQEAYLRYQAAAPETIQSPKAYLSAIVTRLCLNQLESARVRRETYIGPWLPEPLRTDPEGPFSPAQANSLHESLSIAFLVLLENLSPLERAVFLLRSVFDYEYAEIAQILGKEETACRQLFSRANKHIANHRPRFKPTPEEHQRMLGRFLEAVGMGELDGLMQLLAADVTMWADGGGRARGAAIRPLLGREAVAKFVLASTRLPDQAYYAEITEMNGEPAVVLRMGDQPLLVLFLEFENGKVVAIRAIGNPEKLKRV